MCERTQVLLRETHVFGPAQFQLNFSLPHHRETGSSSASLPADSPRQIPAVSPPTPPHFLADLYTFKWTELNLRLPPVSAFTVGLCLSIGIAAGHPSGGLIAGGGAFTVGFGANQRIADSRLLPMLVAIFACASATLMGTIVGPHPRNPRRRLALDPPARPRLLHPPILAAAATLFALLAFATNAVNYALYTAFLTSYIVFLLSLNQIPGPVLAYRRAWCTILGGLIALVIHLDALRRHRNHPSQP